MGHKNVPFPSRKKKNIFIWLKQWQ